MRGRAKRLNWTAALILAALVLPFGGLWVWLSDRECNHLDGDIAIAARNTPRGAWCQAVQWDHHWLVLLLAPAALTWVLVLLVGRRPWLYVLAWGAGALAASVPIVIMDGLRAYPLV